MLKYAGMQKNNIILKMQVVRTSVTVLLAVLMILLMSAGAVRAADGKVIPLTDELKKALAPLGEGVVGKAIPAPVIHNPAKTFGMQEGTFEFQYTKGSKDAGKNHNEVYTKLPSKNGNPLWSRNIGGEFIEEIEIKPDGSMHINDDIAVPYSYRAHYDPGLSVAQKVSPGESWDLESKVSIYHVKKNPNKIAHHGKMSVTRTYVGAHEVTTPAGKVAEVEGLKATAIMIINIHQANAKVLVKYPKGTTPKD